MNKNFIEIEWPNGNSSNVIAGSNWFEVAQEAGVNIPTGCLGGSCGACEIEVNGRVVRACINKVPQEKEGRIKVKFIYDPYWQ